MSRYKAYPEYQDSGVEWLGKIPSGCHYRVAKIRQQDLLALAGWLYQSEADAPLKACPK